jgi:hypothetical protein
MHGFHLDWTFWVAVSSGVVLSVIIFYLIAMGFVAVFCKKTKRSSATSRTPASEVAVEKLIQENGLTAPRITPQHIDSVIVSEDYNILHSGRTMVCELTLANGFTVRGEASVLSKENFNTQVGERVSYDNARRKVWQLEAYLSQQRTYEAKTSEAKVGRNQ